MPRVLTCRTASLIHKLALGKGEITDERLIGKDDERIDYVRAGPKSGSITHVTEYVEETLAMNVEFESTPFHWSDELLTTRILTAIAALIGEQRVAEETYLDGLQIVLQQPEFHDVERLRVAVDRLNAYDVRGLVEHAGAADIGETRVLIGEEHGDVAMRDWSVVLASYGDGETNGMVAVLGPTRMHYQRSIPRVRYVASLMSSLLHDVR